MDRCSSGPSGNGEWVDAHVGTPSPTAHTESGTTPTDSMGQVVSIGQWSGDDSAVVAPDQGVLHSRPPRTRPSGAETIAAHAPIGAPAMGQRDCQASGSLVSSVTDSGRSP